MEQAAVPLQGGRKVTIRHEQLERMSHSELVMECRRLDDMSRYDNQAYDQLLDEYRTMVTMMADRWRLLRMLWDYAQEYPERFTHEIYSALRNSFISKEPF